VQDVQVVVERVADGRHVVAVYGVADIWSSELIRRPLADLVDAGARDVVVDLEKTVLLDSTVLGVLLDAHKQLAAAGGKLTLARPNELVQRLLRLTGLDRVVPTA